MVILISSHSLCVLYTITAADPISRSMDYCGAAAMFRTTNTKYPKLSPLSKSTNQQRFAQGLT